MKKIRKLKDELSSKDSKRKTKTTKAKVRLTPYDKKYSKNLRHYLSEEE